MIAAKGKLLSILTLSLLLFASSITIANASQTRMPFYLVARDFAPTTELQWHWADDAVVAIMGILEGIVEDAKGDMIGTIILDRSVHVRNFITQTSTITAQFVINFHNGAIIEGTMTVKVTYGAEIVSEGKFAGHGDMNVKGDIYNVPGSTSAIVLDGYSW